MPSAHASVLDLGLIIAAVMFGLRHGVDWDHIAAITDVTATQQSRRRGVWYGTLYALGHASVVFLLGIGVIALGSRIPTWVDDVMARVVGATLVLLGVYVAVSLVRHGRDFRMQSRWILVIRGVRKANRYLATRWRPSSATIEHEHPHLAVDAFHHEEGDPDTPLTGPTHVHRHHHDLPETYGVGAALTIGALHGVGAETPTQVMVFLAAAGAGKAAGVIILIAFLIGLFTANTLITLASAFGLTSVTSHPRIYLALASAIAMVSLVLGTVYLLGLENVLSTIAL